MEQKKYYFITPDIATPAGGIKVIYQLVDLMNRNGFDAYIVHMHRKFKCRYAKTLKNLKYVYLQDGKLFDGATDVIFVPEPDVKLMAMMKGMDSKKIVFNQNWAYTYSQFREINNESILRYQDLGIYDVMTVTEKIKQFLDFAMNDGQNLKIGIVHPFLSEAFSPKKLEEKTHQIAFMPRKNFNIFQEIFSIIFGKNKTIRWVQIDNMTEDAVAKALQDSTMFLALGFPEGLSLPPLEAMKSGCVVLGYSGYGGLEYMIGANPDGIDRTDANMFVFPDCDIVNLSQKIFEVWSDIENKKNLEYYQSIADNGVKTAMQWNEKNTEKMLLEYLKTI